MDGTSQPDHTAPRGAGPTPRPRADGSSVPFRRSIIETDEAFSGAAMELWEFRDGRRSVAKYLPVEGDWLTRATGGRGRLRRLRDTGVLERVDAVADHTIVELRTVDGGDVVVMRDASAELLPSRVPVSRATSRLLLGRLAAMHGHFRGMQDDHLCSVAARYAMFSPSFHATDVGSGRHPLAERITRGWSLFEEHVHPDVVRAVSTVHREPERLEHALADAPTTLLHGDVKLENLGLWQDGRPVMIDWGELTGVGPREIDVAWYALKSAARIGCSPAAIFADYEAAASEPLDPGVLDVVCLGSLAQMGFRFALGAYETGPEPTVIAGQLLAWWVERARSALDRIGPDW